MITKTTIIITGDFNVANNEIDMWNPETYKKHKSPGIFKRNRNV